MSELLTPQELAADREYNPDAPPTPRVDALHELDRILARLGDTPELLHLHQLQPDHHCCVDTRLAYALCDDCDGPLHRRRHRRTWQLGQVHVCRHHALLRIRAGHRAAHMQLPEQPARPDDLNAWLPTALRAGVTERTLEHLLNDWHIDTDTRIGLQERYADLIAAQALTAASDDTHYDDREAA